MRPDCARWNGMSLRERRNHLAGTHQIHVPASAVDDIWWLDREHAQQLQNATDRETYRTQHQIGRTQHDTCLGFNNGRMNAGHMRAHLDIEHNVPMDSLDWDEQRLQVVHRNKLTPPKSGLGHNMTFTATTGTVPPAPPVHVPQTGGSQWSNGAPTDVADAMERVVEWMDEADKLITRVFEANKKERTNKGRAVQRDLLAIADWMRAHPGTADKLQGYLDARRTDEP